MLNLLLAVLMLIAIAILIAIIGVLGLWLSDSSSIVFPGLGIIIATPLVLAFLIVVEAIVVTFAAFLVRYLPILH